MPQATNDLFVNEDFSKPENRINIALFGLMTQGWFREWFLKELNLPTAAVVYPPMNWNGARPDLKVVAYDESTLAWIEVELGTNEAQVEDYRHRYSEPIKTVWGRQSNGGDLSLEKITCFLDSQKDLSKQTQVNVGHLRKLIQEGLEGHTSSPGRSSVSEEMRRHPLVVGLTNRLGDKKLRFNLGSRAPQVGYLKADTTDTPNNRGFSLRVRGPKGNTVSLLNIAGRTGLDVVNFPTEEWLKEHLPDHSVQTEAYASLLDDMELDIRVGNGPKAGSLPLDTVLGKLNELAYCVQALA